MTFSNSVVRRVSISAVEFFILRQATVGYFDAICRLLHIRIENYDVILLVFTVLVWWSEFMAFCSVNFFGGGGGSEGIFG